MKKVLALLFLSTSLCFAKEKPSFWTLVSWENPEGVLMKGNYHAAASPEHFTWVLMHGLGSSKEEWDGFAQALAEKGIGVFAFDAPGHGKSQRMASGVSYDYKTFQISQWADMPAAFGDAVQTIQKKFQLKPDHLAIGGASLGANVALVYGANTPEVPAVLLLSAGIEYAGVNIEGALARYRMRSLCVVASPGDAYAAQTAQVLAKRRSDAGLKLIEGPGAMHGVNMLDATTTERILAWMLSQEKHAL